MKRRDVLKYTAYATGAALSSPLLNSILSGAVNNFIKVVGDYTPQLFNEKQFLLIQHLADTILPKTDSPSASEVKVPETIDSIVGNVYGKGQQKTYLKRFTALENYLNKAAGRKNFIELNSTQKLELIKKLETPEVVVSGDIRQAYLEVKQQTISYYLITEEISKNHLNYLPVPGHYDPCISLDDVDGKAWAL